MAAIQYFLNNEQLLLKNQVPIKVTEYDTISWPHCMHNLLGFESIFRDFIWLSVYSNNLITVHALCFKDEFIKTSQYKMVAKIPPIVSPTYIATIHTGSGSITVRTNRIYLFPLFWMSGFHYFFFLQQKRNICIFFIWKIPIGVSITSIY